MTVSKQSQSTSRQGVSVAAPKAREGRRGLDPESDALETYFRDLDGESLLTPDQERDLALRILELRREYWMRLLDYGPFVEPMLAIAAECMTAERFKNVPLAKLRKAAEARSKRPNSRTRDAEARALTEFAHAMADADPSCDIADMLAADVEALASGARVHKLDVRRPRRGSAPFASYVQGIQRSRMALQTARRSFARGNLRLVVTMAQRYRRNGRMSLSDLIQEGNVGLMTAVDRFDPRRGFRFSTYGSWWIRHAISRALSDKGRSVRLPVHVIELQSKLSQIRRDFEHKHQREPDDHELAELAGVPVEKVERFGRVLLEQDTPSPQVTEQGRNFGVEVIADESPAVEETLHEGRLDDSLEEALDILRPMEADILRMRFGLDDRPPMTLREIGGIYSLSRERIRQIQERALAKLRGALESDGFTQQTAL